MSNHQRSSLKAQICNMGEACTFFIHHCSGFPKASMIWSQGLLHLALLFFFNDSAQPSTQRRFGENSDRCISIRLCYMAKISPTQCCVHEDSSGLAPLCLCGAIPAPFRLHVYWVYIDQCSQQGAFETFSTIQISTCASYRQAWILEHMLIDSWQPKLNYPFITLHLHRTALGFRASSKTHKTAYAKFGRRLWIKLHKKVHPSTQPYKVQLSRYKAWNIL